MRKELFTTLQPGTSIVDKFSDELMEVVSGSGKLGKAIAAPYEFDEKGEKKFDESKFVTVTANNCIAFRFVSHPEEKRIPTAEIKNGTLVVENTPVPNTLIEAVKVLATMPGAVLFSAKANGQEALNLWAYDVNRDRFISVDCDDDGGKGYTTMELITTLEDGENKAVFINVSNVETRKYGPEAGDKEGEEYPYITGADVIAITNNGRIGYQCSRYRHLANIEKVAKIDGVYGMVIATMVKEGKMVDRPEVLTEIFTDLTHPFDSIENCLDGEISGYIHNGPQITYVTNGVTHIKTLSDLLGVRDLAVGNTEAGYRLVDVARIGDETKLVFANDKRDIRLYTVKITRDRGTFVTCDDEGCADKVDFPTE